MRLAATIEDQWRRRAEVTGEQHATSLGRIRSRWQDVMCGAIERTRLHGFGSACRGLSNIHINVNAEEMVLLRSYYTARHLLLLLLLLLGGKSGQSVCEVWGEAGSLRRK